MSSIAFIIPYFGKFNNYFQLWLDSCKYNPGVNWIIFTDDKRPFIYPPNVKVVYTTLADTKKHYQSNFDFEITLDHAYQICEYRVAFGDIYKSYLDGFDFWGYCDTDVLWGNILAHLPDEVLNAHQKISWRGHLTLYRNDPYVNALYKSEIGGVCYYKNAFSNTTGYQVAFDEGVINCIFENAGMSIYKELIFADLRIRSNNFSLLHFSEKDAYKNEAQVFLWNKGELLRIFLDAGTIKKDSFCYIHFLKRNMEFSADLNSDKPVLIIPNRFINYENELTASFILEVSKKKIYWPYILNRLSVKYIREKIRYFNGKRAFKKRYPDMPVCKMEVTLSK